MPNNNQILQRNFKIKIVAPEVKQESEWGIIEAYVSVFGNVDSYGDIIQQGAFTQSLQEKLPKGVWMHNWDQPIAKTLEAREDPHGLYIKGQLIKGVQKAEEAYLLLKEGVIDEFSIGFYINDYEMDNDGHRVIKSISLAEWSPVLLGANPDTELISVKKKPNDGDACEMPDGTPGEMHPNDDGDMVCMAKKSADPVDPPPLPATATDNPPAPPASDETTPASGDNTGNDKTPTQEELDAEKARIEAEEKVGKVLSEKNRAIVQTALDGLNNLSDAINSTIKPLQELLDATNDSKGVKVVAQSQEVKILRVKQAMHQIKKNSEFIFRVIKQ